MLKPTRIEDIKIYLELDHEKYLPVADQIQNLCGRMDVRPGDVVKFNYSFFVQYWGTVEENLEAVLTILEKAESSIICVDSQMLDGATCLVARVVEKLRKMQTIVAARE